MIDDQLESTLEKAVAYYLYIASKEVPDDDACLYRAAALRLIGKPVDEALLREAAKRKSNDDPLYSNNLCGAGVPLLEDVWVETANRVTDASIFSIHARRMPPHAYRRKSESLS